MFWAVATWVVVAVAGGVAAANRNRSAIGWFLLCALFPPLILILFALSPRPRAGPAAPPSDGGGRADRGPGGGTVACPKCGKRVLPRSLYCRFCGHDFGPGLSPPRSGP